MPSNKRHHYVPQFYLRRFSEERKFISCFNKSTGKFIPKAPIKGQCQINRYYDWDPDVERRLGIIESAASVLISRICETQSISSLSNEEWSFVLVFIALQSARTKTTGDSNNKMTDYFAKLMAGGASELAGIDVKKFKIKNTYPTALPIKVALDAAIVFESMGIALLKNNTKIPFLGSDNPVIRYNSEGRRVKWEGTIGLDCPGLQIIFPLSPTIAIYLFDTDVYKRPSNTGLRILSAKDAARILCLQYLWSDQNLYLRDLEVPPFLEDTQSYLSDVQCWERTTVIETEPAHSSDGTTGSLVIHYHPHQPIEIEFDFAKIKSDYDPDRYSRSLPRRNRTADNDHTSVSYVAKASEPRAHFEQRFVEQVVRRLAA